MNEIVVHGFDYALVPDADARAIAQEQAASIRGLLGRSAQDIIEIGERLESVKARLEHGLFMKWVASEFAMTYRHASNFLQVSQQFGKVEKISTLPIQQSALYVLSAPSVPERVRQQVIERAQGGETITHAKAKEAVQHANRAGVRHDVAGYEGMRVEVKEPRAKAKTVPQSRTEKAALSHLKAIVSHWNEFGAENGLDELMSIAEKWLRDGSK
jgi:hypothetical protein